ncbi:hypothetical protein C0995_008025 [Termitomyces sp. Mi166|nr:hypothetical protein C0995_008025 [Termitomyces sp. Mi166\
MVILGLAPFKNGVYYLYRLLYTSPTPVDRWGNRVYKETSDWKSRPLKTLLEGETFGPSSSSSVK